MQGSRMIGSSLSLVLCSCILNKYRFEASMLTLFFLVAIITIVPIVTREHKGEKYSLLRMAKPQKPLRNCKYLIGLLFSNHCSAFSGRETLCW